MKTKYHERGKKIDGFWARKHPNYTSWAGMKSRCDNTKEVAYKNYGGRGIKVCARWYQFENFCIDMGVRPSKKHSIERVNNNKGYSKSNCVWGTRTQQCLNRRTFSNNTTGFTGIELKSNGRYIVRYSAFNNSYRVGGTFATIKEAKVARKELVGRVMGGEDVSDLLERPARYDCVSGVRGITKAASGYIVRFTKNGVREYVGHFPTLEKAKQELEKWKAKKN